VVAAGASVVAVVADAVGVAVAPSVNAFADGTITAPALVGTGRVPVPGLSAQVLVAVVSAGALGRFARPVVFGGGTAAVGPVEGNAGGMGEPVESGGGIALLVEASG
jgi:hypothetical protein